MRLAWITDPHFNFLPPFGARAFGQYVAKETGCDAVVLTGDIAESKSLEQASRGFAEGLDKPVYFVLGNHDYYSGSIEEPGPSRDGSAEIFVGFTAPESFS